MIARQSEVEAICKFIQESKCAGGGCLWIHGKRGVGKTRCVQHALALLEHKDVIEIDLAKHPADMVKDQINVFTNVHLMPLPFFQNLLEPNLISIVMSTKEYFHSLHPNVQILYLKPYSRKEIKEIVSERMPTLLSETKDLLKALCRKASAIGSNMHFLDCNVPLNTYDAINNMFSTYVVGREDEIEQIQHFLNFNTYGMLWVSGASGSGKTTCVQFCLQTNKSDVLYLNAQHLLPGRIELTGDKSIVFVDEADLLTKQQCKDICTMSLQKMVICCANKIIPTHLLITKYKLIVFKPYQKSDFTKIVTFHFPLCEVEPKGLQFWTMKWQNSKSDVRDIFTILSADCVKMTYADMRLICKDFYGSDLIDIILTLPTNQQFLLAIAFFDPQKKVLRPKKHFIDACNAVWAKEFGFGCNLLDVVDLLISCGFIEEKTSKHFTKCRLSSKIELLHIQFLQRLSNNKVLSLFIAKNLAAAATAEQT